MDLANIIALVSQHNADPTTSPEVEEQVVIETVIGRNIPKAPRGSKAHAKDASGAVAAPIHDGPKVFGVTLPERNTLDAKGFLLAARNAGKRFKENGAPFFDKAQERNDLICAIHAYVGYDNRRDFGSQDVEARAKAQRELRGVAPGPTREEKRSVERTLSGFVAGMPQPAQKLLANLRAREQAAVEAMIDAKTEQDRATHAAVLEQIRAAIAQLV